MCKETGNNNNNNKRELKVKLSVRSKAAKGGSIRVYRPPKVSILQPEEQELAPPKLAVRPAGGGNERESKAQEATVEPTAVSATSEATQKRR